MDAVTPKGAQTADTHSHIVRPESMEWQQTRFPGCEAKTLLFDRSTGLMTALMRFEPGAVLPDHEHVNIEQTYVLEGSLVDKEGPAEGIECKAGEFIWREQGSRHVAWCPQGGLMLAIFQVPNKFFEADGRVVDAAGAGLGRDLGPHRQGVRRSLAFDECDDPAQLNLIQLRCIGVKILTPKRLRYLVFICLVVFPPSAE